MYNTLFSPYHEHNRPFYDNNYRSITTNLIAGNKLGKREFQQISKPHDYWPLWY